MTIFDAIETGDLATVSQMLVDDPTLANQYNAKEYAYPLHWAAHFGQLEIAQLLIEHGADVEQDSCNGDGSEGDWTPLLWAAQCSHTSIVRLLLDKGANVNKAAPSGKTALSVAAENLLGRATEDAQLATMQLLLEHGAKITGDGQGWTALHWAVCYKKLKMCALLLEYGANVNALSDESGTPLCMAAKDKNLELLQVLLAHGADVSNADNEQGYTALHFAYPEAALIHALIMAGADIHQQALYDDRITPLDMANSDPDLRARMLRWHQQYQQHLQLRRYRAVLNILLAERIYAESSFETSEMSILPREILISVASYFCDSDIEMKKAIHQVSNEVAKEIDTALETRGYTLMYETLSGKNRIQARLNQAMIQAFWNSHPKQFAIVPFNPSVFTASMASKKANLHAQSELEFSLEKPQSLYPAEKKAKLELDPNMLDESPVRTAISPIRTHYAGVP